MDTKRRDIAQSAFKKYESRDAKMNEAVRQEHTRQEAAVKNCTACDYCGWNGKRKKAPADIVLSQWPAAGSVVERARCRLGTMFGRGGVNVPIQTHFLRALLRNGPGCGICCSHRARRNELDLMCQGRIRLRPVVPTIRETRLEVPCTADIASPKIEQSNAEPPFSTLFAVSAPRS